MDAYCRKNHHHNRGDRFGRMFPDAAPLYHDPRILAELGALGGPMDAGAAPERTETVPVGHVFFGQFVDHDVTLDVVSSFESVNDADATPNARTPTLDLDCIYGGGREATPFLYDGPKLLTGADLPGATAEQQADLLRLLDVAVIGDPRNDENRIVSQIQLAMIRFHNKICDEVAHEKFGAAFADMTAQEQRERAGEIFEEARQITTWHYQWAVVEDFLTTICGEAAVRRALSSGRRFYTPDEAYIPVEFSVAAYRFGHSMVPMRIQVQQGQPAFELFGPELGGGFSPVAGPQAVVDMHELFETSANRAVQRAERLDGELARDLLQLGPAIIPAGENSLAARNLIRGQSFLLPSGETVAACMGRDAEEIEKVRATAMLKSEGALEGGIPLWYYLLIEAETIGREGSGGAFEPGEGLGPVGATIVAETIIGLIELDERSWLASNRRWTPKPGVETVGAILTY